MPASDDLIPRHVGRDVDEQYVVAHQGLLGKEILSAAEGAGKGVNVHPMIAEFGRSGMITSFYD